MKIASQIIENYVFSNFNPIKRAGSELHFNSPFSQDGKFRLYVHPETSTWYDQKNQRGGSFSKFVAEIEDINEKEVYFFLIKNYSSSGDISFQEIIEQAKDKEELVFPNGLKFFRDAKKSLILSKALTYLIKRKIPKKYISTMGYIFEPGGEWNNRIFVPFFEDGKIVYYIGRAYDNNPLRYNTPKGFDSKSFVFNIDEVENEVAICEGVFDAMSVDNIPTTALLSADIGTEQIKKIMEKGIEKITLIPDKDETGNKTLEKNIEKILYYSPPSLKPKILIYYIPKGFKDFNEYRVKTGCNIIEEKDCILYNKKNMMLNSFIFKIKNSLTN